MKKIIVFLAALTLAGAAFPQDLQVSGEVKTGVLWYKFEDQLNAPNSVNDTVYMNSKDDAGSGPGRFRVNVDYFRPEIHIGFKFRLNWEKWNTSEAEAATPQWSYAFGYGKFFQDQLTVSLGRLGASPWGTGGPEAWKELESIGNTAGIRFEYEPSFIPGLNAGFVLNGFNDTTDVWSGEPITLLHILEETVLGVSYTHDYFHARAAFRFDSEVDGVRGPMTGNQGGEFLYRLEERALKNYVPGLQVWAMGYVYGIGADEANEDNFSTWNWLFVEYAPDTFVAQIRFGYDAVPNRDTLYIKPSFYLYPLAFFSGVSNGQLIKVGASFEYRKDFGEPLILNDHPNADYRLIELRPLLQLTLSPNAYVAFEYFFQREWVNWSKPYKDNNREPLVQTQWINIRVGVTY